MGKKKEDQTDSDKLTFEEAFLGLSKAADVLAQNEGTLAEAIKSYEMGISYYDRCKQILESEKQRIEVYAKDTMEVKDF